MQNNSVPKVGVALLIPDKRHRTLFIKRKGSYGAGTWALPGGHLDYGETLRQAAAREAEEELGIKVNPSTLTSLGFSEDIMGDRHYLTFYFRVNTYDGTPAIMEPNKCEEIRFTFEDEIPEPIFDITDRWFKSKMVFADDIE